MNERKSNCNIFKNIDIFGKNIQLYYKGKEKKYNYFGSTLTIAYGIIYIAFCSYKLYRMFNKKDITFYDTYAYIDEPPVINVTNDNFYGGFALEDPNTYDAFIDETIYYPKAYFKSGKREGANWVWKIKAKELEKCKINKFGEFYRDIFKEKTLDTLYCFKKVDEELVGHFSYDYYSFFYIEFFPCINTTENNNHCKSKEIIDYYLKNTFVSFQLQDIELTPQNYTTPVRARNQDVYTKVGKKLFQEIHIYFQIVNIITDIDLLGFSEFEDVKNKKYLKYDSSIQMTNIIEDDIYETGESFCDVTIKLSEKILTEKRRYTKFTEVLRDVGGLTEVVLSLIYIITFFSSRVSYDLSLVNNLFEFDTDKKLVLIHNKYQNKKIKIKRIDTIKLFDELKIFGSRNTNNIKNNKPTYISEEFTNNSKNIYNIEINKNKLVKINDFEIKNSTSNQRFNNVTINNENIEGNINHLRIQRKMKYNNYFKKKYNNNNCGDEIELDNKNNNRDGDGDERKDNNENKNFKIDKIKINKAYMYICFLCVRKRQNIENVLLDEGKRLIVENLDIINIFKRLYKDKEKEKDITTKDQIIKMSDICKNRLEKIYKND